MAGRTIAIGDIHGCATAFDALLQEITPASSDTIVTLGDYIDRGPASRDVLERLMRLSNECELIPLLGNHEVMLLIAREHDEQLDFWLNCGGRETLESYGGALDAMPPSHLEFLEQCGASYETSTHLFLHANYDAELPLEDQNEHTLFWKHLTTEMPKPHVSGRIAVVGHTPQVTGEILDVGHLICIDTFCYGNGRLTALDVDTRQLWQVDRDGSPWNIP